MHRINKLMFPSRTWAAVFISQYIFRQHQLTSLSVLPSTDHNCSPRFHQMFLLKDLLNKPETLNVHTFTSSHDFLTKKLNSSCSAYSRLCVNINPTTGQSQTQTLSPNVVAPWTAWYRYVFLNMSTEPAFLIHTLVDLQLWQVFTGELVPQFIAVWCPCSVLP